MSEAEMSFTTESSGYEKTSLSDLQGAWTLLRESVVETGGFDGMELNPPAKEMFTLSKRMFFKR